MTDLSVSDSPKMLRESLCSAQAAIVTRYSDDPRTGQHIDRLQRLIDECDRHRPLGSDGKHGDRHTLTCGCDETPCALDRTTVADPFRRVIEEIVSLNERKRSDYTGGDPWENFKDSARQTNTTPGMSAETLIATKQSRLRQLLQPGREPANEAVRDSLIDRACYALIAVALHDAGLYNEENI